MKIKKVNTRLGFLNYYKHGSWHDLNNCKNIIICQLEEQLHVNFLKYLLTTFGIYLVLYLIKNYL